MPEEPLTPPPGEPDSPPPASKPDDAVDQNLDALLAQAAALVEEVSSDLGRVDQESHKDEALPDLANAASSGTSDVERRLEEVDELLGQTREALGTTAVQTPATRFNAEFDPPPTTLPPPSSASDIPDFMAEFTRPDETAERKPSRMEPQAGRGAAGLDAPTTRPESLLPSTEVPPPDGSVQSTAADGENQDTATSRSGDTAKPARPVTSGIGRISSFKKPPDPIDLEATLDDANIPSLEPEKPGPSGGPREVHAESENAVSEPTGGMVKRVDRFFLAAVGAGVSLMEMIDRPLSRLGDRVREVVGLFAVATAATAFILLLVSLFR